MKDEKTSKSSRGTKLIHVKIIDGTQADVVEIGQAMKKLKSTLDYDLQAIVTNDKVELKSVDDLLLSLYQLKKQIETDKTLK